MTLIELKTYQPCECERPHGSDEKFFVTIVDGPKVGWLLGPYDTHWEAMNQVDRGRRMAREVNDRETAFAGFGTTGVKDWKWRKISPVFGK